MNHEDINTDRRHARLAGAVQVEAQAASIACTAHDPQADIDEIRRRFDQMRGAMDAVASSDS